MHRIIDAQFLPLFELGGGVDLLPALVVDELVLGTRHIGDLESGILHHVIDHAAVAAMGQFPVPGQFEIRILLVGDDVAGAVAAVAGSLDAAIHHLPAVGEFRAVEVTPAAHILAVEKELPAIRLFCPREAVFLLAGTRESDTNGRNREDSDDFLHISESLGVHKQKKRSCLMQSASFSINPCRMNYFFAK